MQKDFSGNVISVGYVGSRGRNLIQVIPDYNVPVPSAAASPATRRPYIVPLPNVTTIRASFDEGTSEYNSLQTTFQRRLRAGLVLNANYTLAKMEDNVATLAGGTNPYGLIPTEVSDYDWGRSELDIRHRIAFSANYELPFGANSTGLTRALLHGWQVNVLGYWQSGLPFTVASSVTRINTTATSDRPNMIKDPVLSDPTILAWFDTTAFAAQALGTAGDEKRNALEGPAQRRLDLSVFKSFQVGGREACRCASKCSTSRTRPTFESDQQHHGLRRQRRAPDRQRLWPHHEHGPEQRAAPDAVRNQIPVLNGPGCAHAPVPFRRRGRAPARPGMWARRCRFGVGAAPPRGPGCGRAGAVSV